MISHSQLFLYIFYLVVIKVNYSHVESSSSPSHSLANPAQPYDSQSSSINIIPQKKQRFPSSKFSFSNKPITFYHSTGYSHKQSPGKVSGGLR